MDTLESLVERAQGGDQNAYGEIVRRFQDMAYGYAYAILGDFQLAEDAAQEAFVEAYHCLPNLREPRAFPGWFKRVVFKHCDRLTRGKRVETVPMDTAQAVATASPGPEKIAEQREDQEWALQAVHDLPAREREATTLYYINGYSQDEIANFLEVPTTTVKSRLHTSRKRLRERMIEMIQETLKSNALPEGFTQETLERAVARAQELNKAREFDQAEELLRDVLAKAPDHAGALKELNRAVMQGRVRRGRWDLLPELAAHGRAILSSGGDDEYVHQEMARTLLLIPAMPEAIAFIEQWIAKKGPNLGRLGMLAWAKGCVADYSAAEALWEELLAMAQGANPDAILDYASMACKTLVDCFASAGEMDRAARVARAGWELCRDLGDIPQKDWRDDPDWMHIFYQAGLDLENVAQALLAKWSARKSAEAQGMVLCIRAWMEDFAQFLPDWLEWARARITAGELEMVNRFGRPVARAFRVTRRPDAFREYGQTSWNLLQNLLGKEAEVARYQWDQYRFPIFGYIETGDLDTAEQLILRAVEESPRHELESVLITIAAMRGTPSPPNLVRRANEDGVKAIDSYEMDGWYLIAREAAAAGDAEKAFDALRRALSRWSNGPFYYMNLWENDAYWGDLLDHPERKRLFEEKRQRIGPIYGELHYFPGW